MADLVQRDDDLKIRASGTAMTVGTTNTTGKYVTKSKQIIRTFMDVDSGDIDTTTGNTYVLTFQQSAALASGYTDCDNAVMTVTGTGITEITFKLRADEPYVRASIVLTGATSSLDGVIYATQL